MLFKRGFMEMSQSRSHGKLYIVGHRSRSNRASYQKGGSVLLESEYIIGNGTYLDQIAEVKKIKKIIRSGMGGEVERARKAVELGFDHIVSIISGGDAMCMGWPVLC